MNLFNLTLRKVLDRAEGRKKIHSCRLVTEPHCGLEGPWSHHTLSKTCTCMVYMTKECLFKLINTPPITF